MEHLACLRLKGIPAKMVIFFLDFTIALDHALHLARLVRICHCMLQGFQFMVEIAHAPTASDGFIHYRSPIHLFNILTEITNGQPLWDGDTTLIRSFLSHNHAKKGCFTRSIRPHQTYLLPRVELKRSVNKNQLLAILLVDIGKRDHL